MVAVGDNETFSNLSKQSQTQTQIQDCSKIYKGSYLYKTLLSLTISKNMESYYSQPGIGVGIGVALIKFFCTAYKQAYFSAYTACMSLQLHHNLPTNTAN